MAPGHVDQGRHQAGQHALWGEVCRLRRLLLEGKRLMGYMESLPFGWTPALYEQVERWREAARTELGEESSHEP